MATIDDCRLCTARKWTKALCALKYLHLSLVPMHLESWINTVPSPN